MPILKIETNIPKAKIPANFVKELSAIVAAELEKPPGYVVIQVVPDQIMTWGATSDPCATMYLMSIGQLGVQPNIKHAKVIFDKVEKDLGIPSSRMYITFDDKKSSEVGNNKTTFYEIFGGK